MVEFNEVFASFEGLAGWVSETTAGQPPDQTTSTELLTAFGVLANVNLDGWDFERVKRFGIGNYKLTQNEQGRYQGGVSVEYAPVDIGDAFEYILGNATTFAPHIHTRTIEVAWKRTTATASEVRGALNMCKMNSLSLKLAMGEPVMITEELLAQYLNLNTNKTYTSPSTTLYADFTMYGDPAAITQTMLMFHDCTIELIEDPDGSPNTITLWGVEELNLTVSRNLSPRFGINPGIVGQVAREFAENVVGIELDLKKDFKDKAEWQRIIDNEYFDMKLTIGTDVITLDKGYWEMTPPPTSDEDLVSESLNAGFTDIVLS